MSKTTKTQTKSTVSVNPNLDPQTPARESTYALGVLAERIGPADPALMTQMLTGINDADLVAMGADVSTSRILTDTTRIYNIIYDYWQRASAVQRRRVRGFTLQKLAVAVEQAHLLEQMQGRTKTKRASAGVTRATLDTAVQAAMDSGLYLRDQAASALRDAAGRDRVLREEVAETIGLADSPDALARGIGGLANVLRRWLGLDNEALTARLEVANLDEEYAGELDQAAQQILAAATAARLRPSDTEQGELDRLDGINLMLLGEIVRAFEHAHNIDPTIPRPALIATRRAFNRRSKPATPDPAKPSTPPAGTPSTSSTPDTASAPKA